MQLNLGEKIQKLRRRDNRTQEDIASALGVTSQAVSRWELGGSYPDMETIPSIANYFGISIDELFGYENDRNKKIADIIARVDAYGIKADGSDDWVDPCIKILREGLYEFPQNEKLLFALADTLHEAGWRRHCSWNYYDEEGFMSQNNDKSKENEYWAESAKICENLVSSATDHEIVNSAVRILVHIYRNYGETEKAVAFANRMPIIKHSREVLLATAADGKEEAKYIGEALLKLADEFAEQLVYGLVNCKKNFETDMPTQKIKGAISLFELICDDGNYGEYNEKLIHLYLYLSRVQWERGYHDEAFESLDNALKSAKRLEELSDGKEHYFTAPLLRFVKCRNSENKNICENLSDDWPFWCNPDYSQVEEEIKILVLYLKEHRLNHTFLFRD